MSGNRRVLVEILVAFAASLAASALFNSAWFGAFADQPVRRMLFLMTLPAAEFSLLIAGSVHDATLSSYTIGLFM